MNAFLRLVCVLLGAGIFLNVLTLGAGGAPLIVYQRMLDAGIASSYGLTQTLFRATPLILLGVAARLSLAAGTLNIGLEGQLIVGSLSMGLAGVALSSLPAVVAVPLIVLIGTLAGALWAGIAAALKQRFKAPEVTTTLMLNFIAAALSGLAMHRFSAPESTHTLDIPQASRLHMLTSVVGGQLSTSFVWALLSVLVLTWFFARTRPGFEWRAFGENARAAEIYGVSTGRLRWASFLVSGGLAGFTGMHWVLGAKGYHEDGFSGGIGFLALGVALLARSAAWAIVPSSLFFGFLGFTSLAVNSIVPKEVMNLLIAAIMLMALVAQALTTRERAK